MKQITSFLIAIMLIFTLYPIVSAENTTSIKVISVESVDGSAIEFEKETSLEIKVEYTLEHSGNGYISIGLSDESFSYKSEDFVATIGGTYEKTFIIDNVIPVNWEKKDFEVKAKIVANYYDVYEQKETEATYTILKAYATDNSLNSVNISNLKCNPEISVYGKENKFEVEVGYDLQTNATAEVYVTLSRRVGNAGKEIFKTEMKKISIGKGTVTFNFSYLPVAEENATIDVIAWILTRSGGSGSVKTLMGSSQHQNYTDKVYEWNKKIVDSKRKDVEALEFYTKPSIFVQSENKEIIALAKEITKGLDGDYEKLLAVHDWVADNIYYDYVDFGGGESMGNTAIDVLEYKRGVCEGYSNLTAALLRSLGIPTKKVIGYALGVGTVGEWTADIVNNANASNHAWNEAFVDDRWIILDTTWDSGNRYYADKVITGKSNRYYFDISLATLSNNHKYIEYTEYITTEVQPTQAPESTVIPPTSPAKFIDVGVGDWFYNDVEYAVGKGLFKGITETEFVPNGNMTRAMTITVLARYKGVNTDGGTNWYEKAVKWGIANGITDGTMLEDNVTREQLATLLYRLFGEPQASGDIDKFADRKDVSDYAANALKWAVEKGIIKGYPDNTINPKGSATRAEVAAIMHRVD